MIHARVSFSFLSFFEIPRVPSNFVHDCSCEINMIIVVKFVEGFDF